MRVNEENFAVGDEEDVEPSYVEQVIGNHNLDKDAHPDVKNLIKQTQAFYQSVKENVQGVAETAVCAQTGADKAAENAEVSAEDAEAAKAEAVKAASEAKEAESAVKMYYPQIVDGEWYVYSEEEGCLAPSGVMATGPKPQKGSDYWTEEDQTEIVNDVLAALPSAEEVAY